MNKYYFFVASLPTLGFENKPLISMEDFLSGCQRQLTASDNELIKALLAGEETKGFGNSISNIWMDFNHALKNQMALVRAKKQGKDPSAYTRGEYELDVEIESAVNDALKQEDLLKAEKIIDEKRWDYLEEIEQAHFFDIANVISYALKLQILEKYKKISSDEGKKILEEYQNIEKLKGVTSERQ